MAEFLNPRPRNFRTNVFKFRTTESGALPTDEDLFKTISQGIFGTAMQAFDRETVKSGLTEEERWAVIYYIQTFSEIPDFSLWGLDAEYKASGDPEEVKLHRYNQVVTIADPQPTTPELITKGKEVYETAKCFQCHGDNGKGNGVSTNGMKDDWKFPVFPSDLTKPWNYRGGASVKDIFTRFTTGVNGTPMPTFAKSIEENDRWALAHYVHSLQFNPDSETNLTAKRIDGDLPTDPSDAVWNDADQIDVVMSGNVIIKPRWQNITIDLVKVKALFNDEEVAIRLEWNDRFANVIHKGTDDLHQLDMTEPGETGNLRTYVPIYSSGYNPGRYRDAVMVQFPSSIPTGTEKPHFLNGDGGHEVNLWWWRADHDPAAKALIDVQQKRMADLKAGITGDASVTSVEVVDLQEGDSFQGVGPAVVELNAKGFKKPFKQQAEESQAVSSVAKFEDGTWYLVMKRALVTDNTKKDIQFERGRFIPFAINAWDGWNKDIGMQKSISSWHFLYLEKPMPVKVYVMSLLALLFVGGAEIYLSKKWKDESGG